jgi:ABC-type sugar transport system substrate-binding protein
MVGFCAPDMPNLTKLREKTGATFVAVGYDLEPAALQGIKDGYGEITLGQNPYLQGYLPILAFARYFKEGTPFPQGWVDVGTEVVDPSNVDDKIARENSPEITTEYYGKLIDEQYGDMNAIAKPFPGTAPAVDETAKNLGLVLHIRIPFTEQIAQGARDAAAKFGYEVEVVGPAGGFDATAQIGMFEALVQKGVDGIAVVAYPAETWKEPIDKAIEAGIPVLTLNVHSAGSKAPSWFGQDEFGSGKLLAEQILKYIKDKPGGDIVLGVCAPGVNVLMDRVNGFIEGMKDHPEFTLQGFHG